MHVMKYANTKISAPYISIRIKEKVDINMCAVEGPFGEVNDQPILLKSYGCELIWPTVPSQREANAHRRNDRQAVDDRRLFRRLKLWGAQETFHSRSQLQL